MPTFIELFAGGGLVRAGLGPGWTCVYANEWSAAKAETYKANYGSSELRVKDVLKVAPDEFPAAADLLWASFPCQDHSSAGGRSGFKDGNRGRLVFHVLALLARVAALGNAPRVIALENVVGLLSADGGNDFERLLTGLVSIGYRVGAMAVDAVHWLPHSRPRVFIVALEAGVAVPPGLTLRRPRGPWYPKVLVRALGAQPPAVARYLLWWTLPQPPPRELALQDVVEPFQSAAENWRTPENVAKLLATCRPDDLDRLAAARRAGEPTYGTAGLKRWDRTKQAGRSLLVRTDGTISCLMGKPDLHYGQLLRVDGEHVGIRPFTVREFGALMGVPKDYRMPPTVCRAARLAGEGVAVPVVRWLAAHLLEPLSAAENAPEEVPAAARVRLRPARARKEVQAPRPGARLKRTTIGTTAYLLPEESARVHELAAGLDVSVHELLMRGLDRMFMERGCSPVRRIPKTLRAGRARRGEGDIARLPSRLVREHLQVRFVVGPRTSGLRRRQRSLAAGLTSTRPISNAVLGRHASSSSRYSPCNRRPGASSPSRTRVDQRSRSTSRSLSVVGRGRRSRQQSRSALVQGCHGGVMAPGKMSGSAGVLRRATKHV